MISDVSSSNEKKNVFSITGFKLSQTDIKAHHGCQASLEIENNLKWP